MLPDRTFRAFVFLAWPIVVSRATQAVIGFSDAAMSAPLGEDAFTAVTAGSLNTLNLVILPMGIMFLIQSFAAQLQGKGTPAAARRFALYGLVLAAIVEALVLALLGHVRWAVDILPYDAGVRDGMADYLVWRLAGTGFIVGTEALGNYRGGLGDTRTPMVANVAAMVSNVALNAVLIYGYLGAPAMGVKGAALASTLSSGIAFAVLLTSFLREGTTRAERGPLQTKEFFRLLRFGLPNGLNWFLEFAAFMYFINVVVAQLGTASVGAFLAVLQVNSVAFMPAFGCASAGAILVGQAIGAGHPEWVAGLVKRTAIVSASWQGFVGLVYALFPSWVMAVFGASPHASVDVVRIGAAILPLSALWQLADAMGMTLSEALRAAGDTAWTLGARLVVAWVIFVPGASIWVVRAEDGAAASILCVVGYLAILSLVFLARFRGGAWRRIDLTGTAEAELAP
jgi:MATE family multidrug resistance protein